MTEMPYHTQRRLQQAVQQAVQVTVRDFFQQEIEEGEKVRDAVRKARRDRISAQTDGWIEDYAVRVEHKINHYGRNAVLTVPGIPVTVKVQQENPLWVNGRKNRSKNPLHAPSWTVTLIDESDDAEQFSVPLPQFNGTDFESVLQQAIVLTLATAYTRSTL